MTDRRKWVTLRFPQWEKREVPDQALNLATARTTHLHGLAARHTIEYLIACAYLQGIEDCVYTHMKRPELSDIYRAEPK